MMLSDISSDQITFVFFWQKLQYEDKLFVRKPKDSHHLHLLAQQIWEGVRTNDKKAVYRYIVSFEADVNAVYEPGSSLTLAKVMQLPEQTNMAHNVSENSLEESGKNESLSMEGLDGCSLLHLACETADIGMLELLLQYGADLHASDSRGHTPIH